MDFGRQVCRPKEPDCAKCKLANYCQAYAQGIETRIPLRAARIKYLDLNEAIVLIRRRNKVLLRKCADDERWAGLWDFPRFDLQKRSCQKHLKADIEYSTGLIIELLPLNHTIKHAVTKFRIKLECFKTRSTNGRLRRGSEFQWKSKLELNELPLNTTGREFANRFLFAGTD